MIAIVLKPVIFALSILLVLNGASATAQTKPTKIDSTQRMLPAWQPSAGHTQIPIWTGAAPDARPVGQEETRLNIKHLVAGKPWVQVDHVSRPTITVYSPKEKSTGAAMVVFPGGGYQILAIDLEGTEVCDWLTSRGMTAVLLKYRVPGQGEFPKSGSYPKSKMALQDAQRAISLVRARAGEFQIDPRKIGVIGFSAGGHLVAATSTLFNKRLYSPLDAVDKVSCRPDFAVGVYPGHLWIDDTKFELNPAVPVTKNTPPTFLLQNQDDPVDPVEHSLVYYRALRKAGVPVEMHLYAKGGHAFGLRETKLPVTKWPRLVETWLETIGMTSPSAPSSTSPSNSK